MFERETFTVQLTDPMLYDRLRTLSAEYNLSSKYLVNLAVRRLVNDVDFVRNLRTGKVEGCSPLHPFTVKICEDRSQHVDCHLLAFQGLLIHDLLELIYDVGIAVRYRIGQHIINGHAQPIDEPHQSIQRQAPLSTFNRKGVSILTKRGIQDIITREEYKFPFKEERFLWESSKKVRTLQEPWV